MRSAVGAVVGGAALGVASRMGNRHSRRKVLGISIPDELNPQRLEVSKVAKNLDARKLAIHVDLKDLGKNVDLKGVVRQIGNFAEKVEARSEDVRTLSSQAKRLSRRVS